MVENAYSRSGTAFFLLKEASEGNDVYAIITCCGEIDQCHHFVVFVMISLTLKFISQPPNSSHSCLLQINSPLKCPNYKQKEFA